MKDLLNINLPKMPVVTGTTITEIRANKERILAQLDEKHQEEIEALNSIHQENMKTLDEYHKAIDEAMSNKDMAKVLKLMKEMNNHLSKLV